MPKVQCCHCKSTQRIVQIHTRSGKHITCTTCLKIIKLYQNQLHDDKKGEDNQLSPITPLPSIRQHAVIHQGYHFKVLNISSDDMPPPLSLNSYDLPSPPGYSSPETSSGQDPTPRSPSNSEPSSVNNSKHSSPRLPSNIISLLDMRGKQRCTSLPSPRVAMSPDKVGRRSLHSPPTSPLECVVCSAFVCQIIS